MRNPLRLDEFYTKIKEMHQKYVPDWRFGQLMINFMDWHKVKFGTDFFYLEEEDFLERFNLFFYDFFNDDD